MTTENQDKRLIDAFSGEIRSSEDIGYFWSVADEEAWQAAGCPDKDDDMEFLDWGCHLGDVNLGITSSD